MRKLATLVSLTAIAITVTACGGGAQEHAQAAKKINLKAIENEIKPSLARQLSDRVDENMAVNSLSCVAKDDTTAKCFAEVYGRDPGDKTNLSINVDIDPNTGKAIWQVDS